MKSIIVSMMTAAGLMVAGSALAADMPDIAKKNGCTACHAIDKKVVGPAWMDVSKKYKDATTYSFGGKDYPLEEGLMMKVSKGGSGNWGSVPMIANDPNGTKQPAIKELVEFVLGLAK
jgi:cytochrome c